MEIDNSSLLASIQKLNEDIKRLCGTMTFVHLLNDNRLKKKTNSIILLQGLINRNLQIGNYRSVIRYFITLNILVKELKKYDSAVKEKITDLMLK